MDPLTTTEGQRRCYLLQFEIKVSQRLRENDSELQYANYKNV